MGTCFIKERSIPFKNKVKVTTVLHARCPIITIHSRKNSMKMDISVADDESIEITKDLIHDLIEKYNELGFPIREFLVFIKHWTKKRCINDSPHRFVNSFGYTLMAIKYIQYLAVKRRENMNLSCLVYGFFSFYALKFDAKKHVIDVMDDRYSKEKDFAIFRHKLHCKRPLVIVDPANSTNNVTNNVRMKQWKAISLELQRATNIYKLFMQQPQGVEVSLFDLLMKECVKQPNTHDDYDFDDNNANSAPDDEQ